MAVNLASPAVVAEILRRRGIHPKRRWGQNFLVDANLLAKVAQAGELEPGDAVLEIGPGLGALTRALAERVRQVLAIEIDPALYAALTEETAADLANVQVLHADFLQVDLDTVIPERLGPGRHPVVANIPYSITSPVVVRLLEHRHLFERIVLMVQREVADRLTGAPGSRDYGSLTLFAHLYADVRRVATVSRRAFLPQPEVDSAIVRLDVRPEPRYPDLDPERFLSVVHAAFQQRRKSLANSLTGPPLLWTRDHARAALAAAGIDPVRRGETLTPDEFAALARLGEEISRE
jgi:16S rRNA (adenine1518-N6/adenine1519-N6)-dimethyltransferase